MERPMGKGCSGRFEENEMRQMRRIEHSFHSVTHFDERHSHIFFSVIIVGFVIGSSCAFGANDIVRFAMIILSAILLHLK